MVILERFKAPSIKLKLKNRNNSFEIVNSPSHTKSPSNLEETESNQQEGEAGLAEGCENAQDETGAEFEEPEETNVRFSPNYVDGLEGCATDSPNINEENSEGMVENQSEQDYGNIPGAEPTPPPEPSPEYPKIRIKTTGLLKESLTITEITDDTPVDGLPSSGKHFFILK